jgi:hypothetical protein
MCTSPVMEKMQQTRWDTFNNPSAVYRGSTNDFALEGTRQDKNKSYHAFLLLPFKQPQTNDTLTVNDITKIYSMVIINDQPTVRKLPANYIKTGDLPTNNISIQIQEHYTNGAWFGFLLPFAFVTDVVTFPFQFIYVASTGGWHT